MLVSWNYGSCNLCGRTQQLSTDCWHCRHCWHVTSTNKFDASTPFTGRKNSFRDWKTNEWIDRSALKVLCLFWPNSNWNTKKSNRQIIKNKNLSTKNKFGHTKSQFDNLSIIIVAKYNGIIQNPLYHYKKFQ